MIGSVGRSVARTVGQRLTKADSGGGGGGGLDILASVGTSTSPTSTGTKAVTGVGFQPKVVLPFGVFHDTDGAVTLLTKTLGCCTASAQASVAVGSDNAVTTSATHRRHVANKVATDCLTGSTAIEGAYSSFDAGGFTLNWSSVASARIFNHIALGGADLEVSLVQCQMNGTNAAQSFAHGLSGAPTGVLFFSAVNNSAPPNTGAILVLSIGAWAGSNQFAASIRSDNAQTTTWTRRMLSDSTVLGWPNSPSGISRTMAVASVDATNVNVTYPASDGYQTYFFMLAIRGAKCQVGTFDPFTGSTIATTGITPKLFMPVFVPGVLSFPGVTSNLYLSIGASDGANNVSCGISDANGVTTTNARRYQSSSSLVTYDEAGNKQYEATAAFSGESVVLTRPSNNQYWGEMGYLVIGS